MIPARRSRLPPFEVMELLARATELEQQGRDVIHLEVGQPGTGAPATAIAEASRRLSEPLGYTPAIGLSALRERIAEWYRDRYRVDVPMERVVITSGASAGFVLGFIAAFEPGTRVAVTEPGYPCYRHILTALGCEAVPIRIGPADGYTLGWEALAAVHHHNPLGGVVVASPANPTGTVIGSGPLAELVAWCAANEVLLVSDEIYHGLTEETEAATALAAGSGAGEVIVVNSFSKYFSMTGWRVGWIVVPEPLVRPVEVLAQHLFIAPPTLSQHVALAAFDGVDELEGHRRRYNRNRGLLRQGLEGLGLLDMAPATGAFYLYADVRPWLAVSSCATSVELCRRLLDEASVAITPGMDFDPVGGTGSARFSTAGATDQILEALSRIGAWLGHPDQATRPGPIGSAG